MTICVIDAFYLFNHLNTDLNPICHLLALFGAHHILHVSSMRVKYHKKEQFVFAVNVK
jgi:hypothetical protein